MDDYLLTRSYEDVEELCADARGWNLDFVPTGRGSDRSSLLQVRAGAVEVGRGRFRAPLLQTGAPPRDHWTFVVPAHSRVSFLWRGHRVRGDSILVFPLNGELHAVSRPDFDVFTISVEAAHLEATAEALHLPSPRRLIGSSEVFNTSGEKLLEVRRVLREVARTVVRATPPHHPRLGAPLLTRLPALLLAEVAAAASRTRGVPPSRLAVVCAAASQVPNGPDAGLPSVRSLAALAGASPRTLRRAFLELYGCGPKEFVLARSYNTARRLLREGDPDSDRVSDIAGRIGFWHMGRFAGEYRRRFGELPSETLHDRPSSRGRGWEP